MGPETLSNDDQHVPDCCLQSGPILHAAAAPVRLSAGYWSPTRPSVFYIAKQDGSVDVWDLLDKTHEPSLTQSVSPAPITNIYPYQVTRMYHTSHLPPPHESFTRHHHKHLPQPSHLSPSQTSTPTKSPATITNIYSYQVTCHHHKHLPLPRHLPPSQTSTPTKSHICTGLPSLPTTPLHPLVPLLREDVVSTIYLFF